MSSPSPRPAASPPFQSALLLAEENTSAAVDRTTLRAAGIRQVRLETAGVAAVRYLADRVSKVLPPSTEIVVCLPLLTDMSADELARLVRLHPLLRHIPLLALTAEPGREIFLRQSGFNAVLHRPFTASGLHSLLLHLAAEARVARAALIQDLRRQGFVPDHAAFDAQLQSYAPPERETMSADEAYRQGLLLAREHKWDEALPYLQKAAAESGRRGEACLAMAALWRDRHEPAKVRSCLQDALQGFLETGAWGKAHTLAARLAAEYPDQPPPLLRELEHRARTGRLDDLADIAGLALDLLPADAVREALLDGCHAAPDFDAALDALLAALQAEQLAAFVRGLENAAGRGNESSQKKRWTWLRRALGRKALPTPESSPAKAALPSPPPAQDMDGADGGDDDTASLPPGAVPPPGPAIALLGDETDEMQPSRLPGTLGDAWTVIRGTRRLYRSGKQ